jgi:hypothetical protein
MYDKPPYTTPGNDIYYQCADLVLREGGARDAGIGDGSGADPGAGSGCRAGTGGVGGLAFIVALLVVARRVAGRSGSPV